MNEPQNHSAQAPEYPTVTFEEELERHGIFVFPNVGTSMMPLLRQGRDLMEIQRKGPGRCQKYDAVLYKRDGRYILHRILQVRPNDYVIVGDHNYHREFGITDAQILGVLTAVYRDEKRIAVTDPLYRCYVHLWCDFYPIRAAILFAKALPYRMWGRCKRLLHREG